MPAPNPAEVAQRPPPDLGALFRAHAPFLLRTVERLTGPGAHVEDVVQEVFLAAHRTRGGIPMDVDARPWLYGVALNIIRHHRRGYARRHRLGEALERNHQSTPQPSPETAGIQRQDAALVHAAIMRLPLPHRSVFVLYELEGLEGHEISRMLDIPENTVWSRLRKARAVFKEAVLRLGGMGGVTA